MPSQDPLTILQGAVKGARRRGRQAKWEDNIKEWTEMEFGDSLSAAEDTDLWKGIVATSPVVPRRPPRLKDWDEMRWDSKCYDEDLISTKLVPTFHKWNALRMAHLAFCECNRLSFGLCNSQASSQRVMERDMGELNLMFIFITFIRLTRLCKIEASVHLHIHLIKMVKLVIP